MKYKKQIQLIAAIVTLIVFPVIAFYLMEAYTHNPFEEVRPWAQFFNILLFELLAWIFVSVTGKIRCGLRIELVTAMIYGISNAYVVRFRTNPIVPWDIFSWKTAASVASNYDFKPDIRMIVVTLAFLGMIVLLQFVKTGKYGCFLYSSMTDKFSSSNITGIPLNPPVRIKIGMVWKKSKYISGDMLTFLHFTRMYYKEHPLIEK